MLHMFPVSLVVIYPFLVQTKESNNLFFAAEYWEFKLPKLGIMFCLLMFYLSIFVGKQKLCYFEMFISSQSGRQFLSSFLNFTV